MKQKSRRRGSKRRVNAAGRQKSAIALLVAIAALLAMAILLLPEGSEDPTDIAEPSEDLPSTARTETDTNREPALAEEERRDEEAGQESMRAGSDEGIDEGAWSPPMPIAEPGRLVMVLDDAGNSLAGYELFLSLPIPLTVAVLPRLQYSVQSSVMAMGSGHEVILHQPMESLGRSEPGPGVVLGSMRPEEVESALIENLATVPGAVGINNHMGSAGTADEALMTAILETVHDRGLFFLDSRTSAQTVAPAVAASLGVAFAERHVFLDNETDRASMLGAFEVALGRAARGETVVMIGHVTVTALAELLHDVLPVVLDAGYTFSLLSDHVRLVQVSGT